MPVTLSTSTKYMHFPRPATTMVETRDLIDLRQAVSKINESNTPQQLFTIIRLLDKMQGYDREQYEIMD
jgi:cytoplasmic iron level regulating protein YaaA (DUF328/UPF0246 family)